MIKSQKFKSISRNKIIDALLVFVIIYILLPSHMFFYPFNGLDPSWIIAINMAISEKLIFGKDFIFTMGPLGYLWTGLFVDVPIISIILFHLLILGSLSFIFLYYFRKIKYSFHKILFTIIFIISSSQFYFEKALVLLFIFLFSIFYYLENKSKTALIFGGFIALISFYIKLNTGVAIIGFLLTLVAVLPIFKIERYLFSIVYFVVFIFLIITSAYLLNTNLPGYITNSIHIIMQYNEGNSIPAPWNILIMALIIWLLYGFIILFELKSAIKKPKRLMVIGFVTASLFIVFKEAFVRADTHMMLFFTNIIPFASLIFIFSQPGRTYRSWGLNLILFSILSLIAVQTYYPVWGPVPQLKSKMSSVVFQDFIKNSYDNKLKNAIDYSTPYSKFPERILKKLENKSVDIIPWDISYIYFNHLNYNPRPIIHSYAAGSEQLDRKNAQKYKSKDAPDYILFALGSIDQRHPFWDESLTKLSLLTHYKIDDRFQIEQTDPFALVNQDFIVFKKRLNPLKIKKIKTTQINYNIGDTLHIPQSENLIYLYADLKYSLYGQVKKTLFQPNIYYANIQYNGIPYPLQYRAILPILKSGVLINKRIITTEDAYLFFQSNGQLNTRAESIVFSPLSAEIQSNTSITLTEYIIEKND